MQLVGRPAEEVTLIQLSGRFEQLRPWAEHRPPIARPPMPDGIAGVIREQAAAHGEHRAFSFEGREVTYGELDAASNRVAHALLADGVGRGDRRRVPREEHGGAVRGDVRRRQDRRDDLSGELAAHGNRDRSCRERLGGALSSSSAATASRSSNQCEPELSTVEHILAVGPHPAHPDFATWRDAHADTDPAIPTDPDDVVMLFYTSGTTGWPKGAMLTNRNLTALVPSASGAIGLDEHAVSLVVMPLFHVAGAGWALFGLMHGAHNVMLRDVDLAAILDAIPRYGITHAVFVPALLQFLLVTPGVEDVDFSSLEMIVYGASPISEPVLVASMDRFGCKFVQAYGLTETCGGVLLLYPEDHDPGGPLAHRLAAAGRPLPDVSIRIVDDAGTNLEPGEVGEVWIRSPSTMLGYWNMPDATADAITPDGWFRSGDAGTVDADGYVYIRDRVKDMVISGGENVYPAEIESVLMAHPAVADVAVIGVPDERWGETVKAIVVPSAEYADDEARTTLEPELLAWSRERLAAYKCPRSVDWTDALPRNPSGKILKRELREPYWQGRDRRIG